ncbi:MAG: PRC-barrel domain containing protein [Chitinivibrionales bacterium]|nr:PRC-barrel domain containing protein [Chitinivibrionales bacterium]
MLRSVDEMRGYTVEAVDGDIGKVYDSYFDDRDWAIRYLVVDTGTWLPGRRVLIPTSGLEKPQTTVFPVKLTREQVRTSPSDDSQRTVSREHEVELHQHYEWPMYWEGPLLQGGPPPAGMAGPIPPKPRFEREPKKEGPAGVDQNGYENHLRSVHEVKGYHIHATDGRIGHIDDFVVEDERWTIRYIIVDTKDWLPGRKVLVAPEWIKSIRWETSEVMVEMSKEEVKNSPEFDPSAPVNRAYEERLYDYYGRPVYWTRD